jgi:hypothetical protein
MNFFHVISSAEFPGFSSIAINVRTDEDSITVYFDGDQAAEKLKGNFSTKASIASGSSLNTAQANRNFGRRYYDML